MQGMLARLIPIRPWIALVLFLVGAGATVVAFRDHNLWLAIAAFPILAGGLGFLLIPLPYQR